MRGEAVERDVAHEAQPLQREREPRPGACDEREAAAQTGTRAGAPADSAPFRRVGHRERGDGCRAPVGQGRAVAALRAGVAQRGGSARECEREGAHSARPRGPPCTGRARAPARLQESARERSGAAGGIVQRGQGARPADPHEGPRRQQRGDLAQRSGRSGDVVLAREHERGRAAERGAGRQHRIRHRRLRPAPARGQSQRAAPGGSAEGAAVHLRAGRGRCVVVAGRGLRLRGLTRGSRRGRGHEPGERHRVAVHRRAGGSRELGQDTRVPVDGHAREDVVVDAAVDVQRTGAQASRESRDNGLVAAERSRERARLCAAVAAEERRAGAAVEHEGAQAIGVPGRVGERDARAVARAVELDVADAERYAHRLEIARRRARAVGVAPVAHAPRAAGAACVDEHDVAAVAQRLEQREHGRAIGRRGDAVAAGADEDRVARLSRPGGARRARTRRSSVPAAGSAATSGTVTAPQRALPPAHGRRSAAAAAAGSAQAAVSATIAIRAHGAATSASLNRRSSDPSAARTRCAARPPRAPCGAPCAGARS